MTAQTLVQMFAPVLILLAWQALAGVLGFVLSRFDTYVAARPRLAWTVQMLRAWGIDVKKIVGASKQLAEARAAAKPKGD